jgi:UPF0271 protein
MRVLDASAFIRDYGADGPTASVPAVREELTDESRLRFDAREGAGMTVHTPDPDSRRRVRSAARETGDHDELSGADEAVLAAALELEATVVSDDYAVQNVATSLGLGVEGIERGEITEQRDWLFQCTGCGRTYDEDPDRCPVCGADATRKSP